MVDELTCPHCDERFTKSEACWRVCLTCGKIADPGEELVGHGPGPGSDSPIFGHCCSSLRVYTRDAAEEKQAEVREKERERFEEAGLPVPWEMDGPPPWSDESDETAPWKEADDE